MGARRFQERVHGFNNRSSIPATMKVSNYRKGIGDRQEIWLDVHRNGVEWMKGSHSVLVAKKKIV